MAATQSAEEDCDRCPHAVRRSLFAGSGHLDPLRFVVGNRRCATSSVGPPTHFPIVRGSAIDGHGWSASGTRNPLRIMGVRNGGQGRNRTNDTRIFSSSKSPVRREKGEEAKRVFAAPTEPNSPTEPMPNPVMAGRPNASGGPMRAMELAPSRPSGDRTASRIAARRSGVMPSRTDTELPRISCALSPCGADQVCRIRP